VLVQNAESGNKILIIKPSGASEFCTEVDELLTFDSLGCDVLKESDLVILNI